MKIAHGFGMVALVTAAVAATAQIALAKGVQIGPDALKTNANTADAGIVHFGGHEWFVIAHDGKDGGGDAIQYTPDGTETPVDLYPEGTATLLATHTSATGQFNASYTGNADYESSDLKANNEGILDGFSDVERTAVDSRTLEGGCGTYGGEGYDSNKIQGNSVTNAMLWPLSVAEAVAMDDDLRNAVAHDPYHDSWWLRTPGMNTENAAYVAGDYASASIFLPCAGCGYGTSLYIAGSFGYFWSSVPLSDYYYRSWYLYFYSGNRYTNYIYRYYGQSVRPVQGFTE